MALEPALPGEPVLRTAQDEEADRREMVENYKAEKWADWPLEAGFDQLDEHRGPIELSVRGEIPHFAAGSLFRTGPGRSKVEGTPRGTYHVSHWFDGFAHSHRFDIVPDGASTRVSYSSRRQAEELVEHIRKTGSHNGYTFAQELDPCLGIWGKMMSRFKALPPGQNVNVVVNPNMPGLGGQPATGGHRGALSNMVITTDNAYLAKIDPDTLEPAGLALQKDLHPDLSGPLSASHGQRDPETGDFYNFNLVMGSSPTYRVFCVRAATGKTEILATFGAPATYIHSFFLSENHVILCLPVAQYSLRGLSIPWHRNVKDSILLPDENTTCKWFVVDRRHAKGLVATFETPSAFFFHSVNAFEEHQEGGGVSIFADLVQYKTHDVMSAFYYDVVLNRNGKGAEYHKSRLERGSDLGSIVRYRLPISAEGAAAGPPEEVVRIGAPHVGELPTMNPRFATKRSRYVYSCARRGVSLLLDCLAKTDMDSREVVYWCGPKGHAPGEPIFVERPGATDEDDGVLLIVVLDGNLEKSYLLCLDAKTMRELGRAECDFAVSFGFHGVHQARGVGS